MLLNFSFCFLQHDFRNFLKQKEALLKYTSCVGMNLEMETMETEDDIQSTWHKNEQSDDKDEDDDFELLKSFFEGIFLFH